jgi:hypothetical protein
MTLSFDRKLVVAPDTLINFIDGEAVILSLKSESYFGLDQVGADMWRALASASSLQTAYETLLNEYDIEPETLKNDLSNLVEELLSQELVELV